MAKSKVETSKTPTVDDIKKRFKAYDGYYNQLHADQKEIDDYYELVFDAKVPKNYPARMPPTARDWIDVGVRHFTLDNPKAKVFLRADNDKAREQVALLETFYNFWLRQDVRTIKRAAKKLLKRGEVFLKVNMDDTYFGSTDKERLFHFPLFLTSPEPINTYASPAHRGLVPNDVIESFNITVAEAQGMCERNNWAWTTTKAPDKSVKWFSYVSDYWRYFSLDDEPVLTPSVQPNILGFCNYVHIDAAAGDDNYDGKPEYLYRSLLWGKKDMLTMEVRNLSQIDAIMSRYAWVKTKVTGTNPEAIKKLYPDGQIPTDPDKILYDIKDEAEINYLQGEQPPQGLFTQLAMVKSYSSPPDVLSGVRPAGVYSGQHQETLLATAKPTYKDAFKNLEDALGIAMGMGTRIVEKVYNSPIQIKNFASEDNTQYRQIKPTDINGHYDCEVQLLAEPPEANDMRKALGKGLRQGGSISHMTELRQYEDMSEKEADDEQAQIAAEIAMQQPAIQAVVAKNAMARMGMQKELEMLEQAEQEAAQKVTKSVPPVPQGEGINTEMAKTRGRVSPELGATATPQEQKVTRELAT